MNKTVILDFGSGSTNYDFSEVQVMINKILDARDRNDSRKRTIIKFQLFTNKTIAYLPMLSKKLFAYAYEYADLGGLECTASVFDESSLDFLLSFDVKSVKIAARQWCYPLIDRMPKDIEIFVSIDNAQRKQDIMERYGKDRNIVFLNCVPVYPASRTVYESLYGQGLAHSISDHTVGLDLFTDYQPNYFEKHVTSYHSERVPDRSSYTCTIEEIGRIL
jgi:sialic acid synthase SpsE